MNKSLCEIAKKAILQAKKEGLCEDDAYKVAVVAVNREARELIGEELPAEMNAAVQVIVKQIFNEKKQVGRPVDPYYPGRKRRPIMTQWPEDLIERVDALTKNRTKWLIEAVEEKLSREEVSEISETHPEVTLR